LELAFFGCITLHFFDVELNCGLGCGGDRVCVWSAVLLFLLAGLGACSLINRFTRLSGELFGLLIAALFIQQAVKVWTCKTEKNSDFGPKLR
jgi:hypothetical protein